MPHKIERLRNTYAVQPGTQFALPFKGVYVLIYLNKYLLRNILGIVPIRHKTQYRVIHPIFVGVNKVLKGNFIPLK